MKMYVGGLATETNTFLPMPTGYQDFSKRKLVYGDTSTIAMLKFIEKRCKVLNWEVIDGTFALADPSGVTTASAYLRLRTELLDEVRVAMPLDAVYLFLHGAMVADGCDDCEGDILQGVREIVGRQVPIGALLDPHCHLTARMTDSADLLVIFKEWPHTDVLQSGQDVFDLLVERVQGHIHPVMSVYDCNMFELYPTDREPMKSIVAKMRALEKQNGILSVSFAHGFPYGDVTDMGSKMLVITDNLPERGERIARELGEEIYRVRRQLGVSALAIDEALKKAQANPSSPVVLADVGDTVGGGAPGDNTAILAHMLGLGVRSAVLLGFWDPLAVRYALKAGAGARLPLRIGGKAGQVSGYPLDLDVHVKAVFPDLRFTVEEHTYDLGDTVLLEVKGIEIVLTSKSPYILHSQCLQQVGIRPTERHIIVVKSTHNFYSGFAGVAAEVIHVASPGATSPDFSQFPYQKAKRNRWPLVEKEREI